MPYIFRGRLCGYICPECPEPLANVTIKLYRTRQDQNVPALAVANPKDTFRILTDDEIKAKQSALIAEGKTDDQGNFRVVLAQKYEGEPFEVDVYCGTVPHKKPIPDPRPLQFTITTLQPMWRRVENDFVFGWDYCIPVRYWCRVRSRFGVWTICGRVTICDTKTPVPGVKVRAFDADWLQQDELGSDFTDGAGKFRIDYLRSDFERTIFSPALNVELVGGPDLYFRVETGGGSGLLIEPVSRGRAADRENAGNCFCVELCLEEAPIGDGNPYPAFTHLGGYKFSTDIDSGPLGDGLTIGDNRAFYSTIRLNGILAKKFNGQPMEYMFEVAPAGTAAWVQVAMGQIARTKIGLWERLTGDILNPVETRDYTVNGTPGPNELVASISADGWVQVPQESNFLTAEGFFFPNGDQINLVSQTLAAFPPKNMTGVLAGNSSTSNGATLAQNLYFSIRMWVREAGNNASKVVAGTCQKVAINNTLYDSVSHHPSWAGFTQNGALAVAILDIQELNANGCAGITNSLTPEFTATHPTLGSVSMSMTGPGGPYAFTLPAAVAGERFGIATPAFVVATLQACAYIVTLSVQVLLTTGDSVPLPLQDQIAFCKD